MDYHELEPEVRRYMRRSTFENMSQDEQKIYIKCARRIIRKLSEMDDRESYPKIAGKLHIPQPSLGFMAVGMRFRGNHNFSEDDNITLELDDDNHVDKYAIKILVDNKHVAFVAAEDNRKLRNIDGLLDRNVHIVKKYANSVKMELGELPTKKQKKKKQHEHEELPSLVTDKYWVHAIRAGDVSTSLCGKWMLFYNKSEIDEKWLHVKDLLEQGRLGYSAKCSTALTNPNARDDKKVIIVYTQDCTDKKDVYRVAKILHKELKYNQTMYYKSDEQTHAGLYAVTGSKKNYIYKYPET